MICQARSLENLNPVTAQRWLHPRHSPTPTPLPPAASLSCMHKARCPSTHVVTGSLHRGGPVHNGTTMASLQGNSRGCKGLSMVWERLLPAGWGGGSRGPGVSTETPVPEKGAHRFPLGSLSPHPTSAESRQWGQSHPSAFVFSIVAKAGRYGPLSSGSGCGAESPLWQG